jgi:hypothetical protein
MTEQNVIDIIRRFNSVYGGGSVGSFNVPFHRHNGSDAPQINSFDINTANTLGLVFKNQYGSYNILSDLKDYIPALIINSTANGSGGLFIGEIPFSVIGLAATTTQGFLVNDGTNSTEFDINPNNISISSTSPNFVFHLPDINPLPAAPVLGDITFSNGQFYGCRTVGVWTVL